MRAVLATNGTTGDVQPLLGLASEFTRRGHAITFAAPPDFGARVSGLGLEFVPLGPPINLRELRGIYGQASMSGDALEFIRRTLPLVIQDTPRMVRELASTCEGADVLLSLPYQLAGRIVHELKHIPLVDIFLSPFGGLSRSFVQESSHLINELRAQYGLDSLPDPLGPHESSSILGLHAVSPELFGRPERWPKSHYVTGFFFFDENWPPEPAIEEFISSGEPPIIVCFGSMLHESPERLAQTVLGALERVGKRAVVQRGWTGLQFNSLPSTILLVDFVPHWWLFRRAACVVHAGGAGTTAAALRAGIPSVIVPHILDQFVWAALLRERGCAADIIPYGELTAERLGTAIEIALGREYRDACTSFSQIICNDRGVSKAVDLVESHTLGRRYLRT